MDFYDSPPKTIDEIELYLLSWLKWIPETEQPVLQSGWRQVMGFRRAFNIHQLWRHPESGYAFHVDEFASWNPDTQPNLGQYPTLSETLRGVAERYHQLWTLRNSQSKAELPSSQATFEHK